MITQQIARGEDQIVEVEQGGRALIVPETMQDGLHLSDQVSQRRAGDRLEQRRPGFAASRVVSFGGNVQALAVGLGQAFALGRLDPFPLFLVGEERAGFRAEVGMRRRQQHPHQPDGRFDRGTDDKRSCHLGEALCEFAVSSLDGGALRMNSAKSSTALPNASRCGASGVTAGAETVRRFRRLATIFGSARRSRRDSAAPSRRGCCRRHPTAARAARSRRSR